MQRTRQYLAPTTTPAGNLCWRFSIPDDPILRAAIYDVLAYLSDPNAWIDSIGMSAIDTAALVSEMLENSDYDIPCTGELNVIPTGTIFAYAGASVPTGYLECTGAQVSRTTYAALFGAIGTLYGNGNGSTTSNLPDLRGRSPAGVGTVLYPGGATGDVIVLANKYGSQYNALDASQLPPHSHTVQAQTAGGSSTPNAFTRGTHLAAAIATTVVGSGANFVIQSPILGLLAIIKT